jgi:hypothetical protein
MIKLAVASVFLFLAAAAEAQAPAAPRAGAVSPNDYGAGSAWLCRPGRQDACTVDLSATIVRADGSVTRESWTAPSDPPIDCFYVYPTVSTDPTPTSDMTADPAELNVIRQQFARFGSACRLYAPMYRQVTLAGLRAMLATGGTSLGAGTAFDDVRDAWRHYLEHDNKGRGVVIMGHSQGSFILAELIRREIDGQPMQSRMVSAMLLGATLSVPRGKDVGGTFQHVPLCRTPSQTQCVISYVSFRSTVPPPANTRFGRVADKEMVAACTNPAALAGGSGVLQAYLSADGRTIVGTTPPKPWVVPDRPIDTPWVSVPGLLTARCASNEHATYLEVIVNADPSDPRGDDITGDLAVGSQVLTDWGLHLIDVNLAAGDLVDIIRQQTKSWLATARGR